MEEARLLLMNEASPYAIIQVNEKYKKHAVVKSTSQLRICTLNNCFCVKQIDTIDAVKEMPYYIISSLYY